MAAVRALIGAIGRSRRDVEGAIATWAEVLRSDDRFDVLGPAPYPVARVNDEWRYRIAVRTKAMSALRDALRANVLTLLDATPNIRATITIDA